QDGGGTCRWQIVDAKVERGGTVRKRPFRGNRDVAQSRNQLRQQGSIHIVMVGKGDERVQMQRILDLSAFQFKRSARRQGRCPVPTTKVRHHASSPGAPL